MTESFPSAVRGGWQPGARFLFGLVRRTLVESLYLLTAPVTAAAGPAGDARQPRPAVDRR